ncbi:MAG: peptidase S41 [Flavobacterium sp.]|nr:MAG: peptidase S41 [Flavobacterium sp.]
MKKIVAVAYLLSLPMMAQDNKRACDIFSKLNSVLQERHYQPKPIDDSLSVYVFNTVMEGLDDNRTLFLQEDYDLLATHKNNIDDYLKNKDCTFFSDFIVTYKNALERNKKFTEEIALENLAYNTKDTIYYSKKSFPYNKESIKIKNFLRKKVTYEILEDVAKLSKNRDSLSARLDRIGNASKSKIIDSALCKANLLLSPTEGFEASIYNRFFSVFCSYFDPHSTYFNYNEKASFESGIATENYSMGLYVTQNDKQEIIVDEIVPGGPAYKTEQISKGDQLIKLGANNVEYTVSCTSLENITEIVFSDNYKIIELTLRRNDGTVYSVHVEKAIMKADEHSVYSFVLGDKERIGYVKIPSFYTAFDTRQGNGCAEDVAVEITKLKKDNVRGIILDLQYNGGGSMEEVIRLAGMFVDGGPISIVVSSDKSQSIIRDYYRGTIYNGPMVVLVNGFSASASEFFAGVMQDYNRALIAGSTTVGKATMQTILPLEDNESQDFVKVTIDKFYRVTGKSSQYKGIVPDVQMPAFFNKFQPRESTRPTALKNDSIATASRFKKLSGTIIQSAADSSRRRVSADAGFNSMATINSKINSLYEQDKAPLALTFTNVFDDVHSMDTIWKEINDATDKENEMVVTATWSPTKVTAFDDYMKSTNEHKIKAIKTDPYIFESINIINDMIALKRR